MTFIAWLIGSKLGRYVALGSLAAVAIGVFILRIYSAGKNAAALKQQQQSINNLRERIRLDTEIRNLPATERKQRLDRWVRE